jgi:hypothetical protein
MFFPHSRLRYIVSEVFTFPQSIISKKYAKIHKVLRLQIKIRLRTQSFANKCSALRPANSLYPSKNIFTQLQVQAASIPPAKLQYPYIVLKNKQANR